MTSSSNSFATYRKDIDGLRAIAVLSVLLFHADVGFGGGYVGVDIFFVISGYLISNLILKDCEKGGFRQLEFWERRVRRIVPALAVVVIASIVAGWLLLLPYDFQTLGQSVMAQSLLLANFYFSRNAGYFDSAGDVKPLLHTWSVAVEEQFYVLFPFFLVACARWSRKILVLSILALSSMSFGLCVWCSYTLTEANFYLLPTRAWELLIGSLLAVLPMQRTPPRWLAEPLSWGGFLAIMGAVFLYDDHTRFPGVTALLPCAGAALVIWANRYRLTSVGQILAAGPVVFLGLISYSLYLWHWPALVFAKYLLIGEPTWAQRILVLAASMIIAVLSWRYIETPFRKRLVLQNRAQILTFACLTPVTLFSAGLAIHAMQGVPARIPVEVQHYANGRTDRAFLHELGLKDALKGDFIELGTGDKHLPIDLVVWGDSHAMAVLPVLDVLCKEYACRGIGATHSCLAPLVGCENQRLNEDGGGLNEAVLAFVRREHAANVLLVAKWNYYLLHGETPLHRGLADTITALTNAGTRIWIMQSVPEQRWDVPRTLARAVAFGGDPERLGLPLQVHHEQTRFQEGVFEGLAALGSTVLDPTDLFMGPAGLCRVAEDGKALYCDNNHLTIHGSMVLRPLFEPIFSRKERWRSRVGYSRGKPGTKQTSTAGEITDSSASIVRISR
jgi:peptidoglycan/LPS O-acetylase OafA/YrhL